MIISFVSLKKKQISEKKKVNLLCRLPVNDRNSPSLTCCIMGLTFFIGNEQILCCRKTHLWGSIDLSGPSHYRNPHLFLLFGLLIILWCKKQQRQLLWREKLMPSMLPSFPLHTANLVRTTSNLKMWIPCFPTIYDCFTIDRVWNESFFDLCLIRL